MAYSILTSHEGIFGIKQSIAAIESQLPALDALEIGIKAVEDDRRARTVGFGGAPNILGVMECDASIMRGDTLEVGSVGAIRGCKNPISAARRLMETLPHVMLAGYGAERFAQEMGLPSSSLLAGESIDDYHRWLKNNLPADVIAHLESAPLAPHISFSTRSDISKGTVTFLLRDSIGVLYGGVSTSGWSYKYPGRLGDSPIIGAGIYVDSRYGGATCTHTGEMTIRAGTARSVVLYMKKGASVREACLEAIDDLSHLKGGYQGPVIIHALDGKGEAYVASTGGDEGDHYYYWSTDSGIVEKKNPEIIALSKCR